MPVRPIRERVLAMNQPSAAQKTTETTQLGGSADSCAATVDLPATKLYGNFDSLETFELWIEAELAAVELQFAVSNTSGPLPARSADSKQSKDRFPLNRL